MGYRAFVWIGAFIILAWTTLMLYWIAPIDQTGFILGGVFGATIIPTLYLGAFMEGRMIPGFLLFTSGGAAGMLGALAWVRFGWMIIASAMFLGIGILLLFAGAS